MHQMGKAARAVSDPRRLHGHHHADEKMGEPLYISHLRIMGFSAHGPHVQAEPMSEKARHCRTASPADGTEGDL
jgi:hypothetical protein